MMNQVVCILAPFRLDLGQFLVDLLTSYIDDDAVLLLGRIASRLPSDFSPSWHRDTVATPPFVDKKVAE